jgi:hypothetical protein
MKASDLYNNSHLMVAGIRVLEHQKQRPPTLDEVCALLSMSLERGNFISRKLAEVDVLEVIEGSYGIRLLIRDHLKLEEIPKIEAADDSLGQAVRQFQDSRKEMESKIAAIKAEQEEKKKNLFSALDKKLKSGIDKNAS